MGVAMTETGHVPQSTSTQRLEVRLLRLRRVTAISILVLAGLTAYWVAARPKTVGAAQEALHIDPAYLDVGEVWENPRFTWTLLLRNRLDREVAIAKWAAPCRVVAVEPSSLTIPAQGTAEVCLTLDLTCQPSHGGCGSHSTPEESGFSDRYSADGLAREFVLTVVPRLADGPSPEGWVVRGWVCSAFSLAPRQMHFDQRLVRGRPFESATVRLTPHIPLKTVVASCDPALAVVEVTGPPDRCLLKITPKESLPAGPFQFAVTVQAITTQGEQLPGIPLQVEGMVMDDLQVVPASVFFGARPVGENVSETVVLQSIGSKPLELKGIEPTSGDITVEPLTASAAVGKAFRVTQTVSAAGNQKGFVRFTVQRQNGETLVIPVVLTYFGLSNTGSGP